MADLSGLTGAINVWPALLLAVVVFSLVPSLALHLGVLLYPKGHPRRAELIAELKIVPRWQQPFWVVETLVAVIFEGVALRARGTHQGLSDGLVVAKPEHVALQAALELLPAKQREIIMLRVVTGLSAEEVAEMLGITPGAVRVQQHRGLVRLTKALVQPRPRQ